MIKKSIVTAVIMLGAISTSYGINANIDAKVKAESDHLVEVYKDLHQNPELGFMEKRTSGIVAETLKKLGYKVITGIGKTGVVGILENGKGPVVMYRADMDCNAVKEVTGLPYASKKTVTKLDGTQTPVMHACGHDAHVTWLLGTAKVMAELKDQWKGTLVLVAQPAEELLLGAQAMVNDGMYKKGVPVPDYLYGMHTAPFPIGHMNVEPGDREAGTDQIDVVFHGIGGHGSSPELTKDPILMAASAIVQYQFIISRAIAALDAAVLTVGSVQAGSDNNVIPDSALVKINLRWYKKKDRELMIEGIKRIDKSIAMAYNLPKKLYPTIKMKGYAVPLVNDANLTAKIQPAIKEALGKDALIQGIPRVMASEDCQHLVIGNKKSKYVYAFIGVADPKEFEKAQKAGKIAPYFNHNGNFKVDLRAIPMGVEAASHVLMELFKK